MVVTLGALLGALFMPSAASARPAMLDDHTRWVAGEVYRGNFPDPTILVENRRYIVASTTTAGINLPIQTSKDLKKWTPRDPLTSDQRGKVQWKLYNEALLQTPTWAGSFHRRVTASGAGGTRLISQWAPSLAKVGGHYVAAFSAARSVAGTARRSCIGVATARVATGPYTPVGRHPLVCFNPSPYGVIDPDIFVDPRTHLPYLLWKREIVPGHQGQRLMARRLNRTGTHFAPHSHAHVVLRPGRIVRKHHHRKLRTNWERNVTENPSMVRYRGRYYLFYSGNRWATRHYAIGYAVCRGPLGPCSKKTRRHPLLHSRGRIAGPGGEDAFVDHRGKLRMVYAAWVKGRAGNTLYGRRMHVATLKAHGKRLRVIKASL